MPLLVDEMVHQVLVLRKEVRRVGTVVIGPDQGVQISIEGKVFSDALQGAGGDADIRVNEKDDVPFGLTATQIASGGRTATRLATDHPAAESLRNLGGVILRAIVHDETLILGERRPTKGLQAPLQVPGTILYGNDNRNQVSVYGGWRFDCKKDAPGPISAMEWR